MSDDRATGTLMPDSDHPMIRLISEHLAALDSIRAAYGELSGAMPGPRLSVHHE